VKTSTQFWGEGIHTPEFLRELLADPEVGGVSWAQIPVGDYDEEIYGPVNIRLDPASLSREDFEITGDGKSASVMDALFADYQGKKKVVRLAATKKVVAMVRELLPAAAVERWHALYKYEKKELERHLYPDDMGKVLETENNWRHLYSAARRAAAAEGRPLPIRHYLRNDGAYIYVSSKYLRVYRRIVDFAAHAVSAGWLDVCWKHQHKVVVGESLAFKDGELFDGERIEGDTITLNMCSV